MNELRQQKTQQGFTIMEIVVATTIFAIAVSAMMALFNYVLKINRRTEALRQATQGMRSLVEFITKEVRNGQIDYSVVNGQVVQPISPCPRPVASGSLPYANDNSNSANNVYGQFNSGSDDNRIGVTTTEGDRECIYYADSSGNPINSGSNAFNGGTQLMIKKDNYAAQSLNPPNFTVVQALFRIRPTYDPYTENGGTPNIQPLVSMYFEFLVKLPTGEQVPIYYQTTISSDKYDIPDH